MDSGGSELTCIANAFVIAFCMIDGALFDATGTCGNAIIFINRTVGFGESTGVLVATCTVSESSGGGPELAGKLFDRTGICIVAIISTTSCMVVNAGLGALTVALVFIYIATEHSGAMPKGAGVGFALTGIFGSATTTTSQIAGFGERIAALADTATDYEFSSVGLAEAGLSSADIGTSTGEITSITVFMAVLGGSGVVLDDLGFTSTVCEYYIAIIKASGSVCDRTGTSGKKTIFTRQRDGFGVDTDESDFTCIANASQKNGLVLVGWLCVAIGTLSNSGVSVTSSTANFVGSWAQ